MNTTNPDEFEKHWKSYVDDFARLRLSASGDDYKRIAELQEELNEIIERIAEENRDEE